jgi:glutamine amidotransferase
MQWNLLARTESSGTGLLDGVPEPTWVYFVHSYAPELTSVTTSVCDYGGPVTASAERGRLWGTQFHPEKSGGVGLSILANFVRAVAAAPAA